MGIAYISKLAPLTVIDIDIILMINEDDNNPGDRGDLGQDVLAGFLERDDGVRGYGNVSV